MRLSEKKEHEEGRKKFFEAASSTLEEKVRRRIVECQEEIYNTAEACRRSNKIGERKKFFFSFPPPLSDFNL